MWGINQITKPKPDRDETQYSYKQIAITPKREPKYLNTKPVTLEMLKSGGLLRGDLVISTITFVSKKYNKTILQEGSVYKVIELYPVGNPEGFVIMSVVGKWYFTFLTPNGCGNKFEKVTNRTEEDELKEFGTIPLDILKLILNKPGISRYDIIEYLSYRSEVNSPGDRDIVKNHIMEAFKFLDVHEFIKLIQNTLNKYEIQAKGLKLLDMKILK
jgi:hypothetical protein